MSQRELIKNHLISGKRIIMIDLYGSKTYQIENPPKEPFIVPNNDVESALKHLQNTYLVKRSATLQLDNKMKKCYISVEKKPNTISVL